MHYHMQNEEYGEVVEACKRYGDQEVCLWEQALGYFARKEENCKAFISQVLQHIDQNNLMPPLLGEREPVAIFAVFLCISPSLLMKTGAFCRDVPTNHCLNYIRPHQLKRNSNFLWCLLLPLPVI